MSEPGLKSSNHGIRYNSTAFPLKHIMSEAYDVGAAPNGDAPTASVRFRNLWCISSQIGAWYSEDFTVPHKNGIIAYNYIVMDARIFHVSPKSNHQ